MTSTDIIGERTVLEQLIYDLQYTVDTRKDDGCSGLHSLGPIGISVEYAELLIKHLESILSKYRMMDKVAEQSKNPPVISASDTKRMISAAHMVRSAIDLLSNVTLHEPESKVINKAVTGILDSAVEELERNDL